MDHIEYLSQVDFSVCEQLPNADSIWLFTKNSIIDGMDLFIPKIRLKFSQFPEWYTLLIFSIRLTVVELHKKIQS